MKFCALEVISFNGFEKFLINCLLVVYEYLEILQNYKYNNGICFFVQNVWHLVITIECNNRKIKRDKCTS